VFDDILMEGPTTVDNNGDSFQGSDEYKEAAEETKSDADEEGEDKSEYDEDVGSSNPVLK
jgi:hypothetical protein